MYPEYEWRDRSWTSRFVSRQSAALDSINDREICMRSDCRGWRICGDPINLNRKAKYHNFGASICDMDNTRKFGFTFVDSAWIFSDPAHSTSREFEKATIKHLIRLLSRIYIYNNKGTVLSSESFCVAHTTTGHIQTTERKVHTTNSLRSVLLSMGKFSFKRKNCHYINAGPSSLKREMCRSITVSDNKAG